ncbi:MAG: hypothetical protein ACAI35_07615 [Candidatus Methylacidiphilales bacterium]|nr:hypothetical protein [Candidatus Methylacidiphilales bacterium]
MPHENSFFRLAKVAVASVIATCFMIPFCPAHGFKVVKDVNSGKPPEDVFVIFEKGKPHEHLELKDESTCAKFSFADDGALQVRITGNQAIKPTIRWKAGVSGLPESFDARAYSSVVIRCKLVGSSKEVQAKGKTLDRRPDNLWFGPSLLNAKNERVGYANMADVAEDDKTPAEMATLVFPTMLFYSLSQNDASSIQGIIWPWASTRENMERDFTLVIEKISLAK